MIGGPKFVEETHRYFHPETGAPLLGVTDILLIEGFVRPVGSQYHLDRGTAIHKGVELIEKGTLDWSTVSPDIEAQLHAFEDFRRVCRTKAVAYETIVWHPLLNFAGRLDWFGYVNDVLALIDYKSGRPGIAAEYQTGGYVSCLPQYGSQHIRRYALELTPKGKFVLYPFVDDQAPRLFQAMAAVAWEKINRGIIKWEDVWDMK